MLGQSLKHLAKVCDLARVDIHPNAPLLLVGTSDSLAAHYRGSYSSAYRTVESDAGEIEAVVSAKQFAAVAALFDSEEEVSLVAQGENIVLRAKGSRFLLRAAGETEVVQLAVPDGLGVTVQSKTTDRRSGFIEELKIASAFVAKSMARPVLTGIRLTFTKELLGIETCDGYAILYRATMPCYMPSTLGTVRLTVPAFDFQLGLDICSGGDDKDVDIIPMEGKVAIVGAGAVFDCSLLAGAWPAMDLKLPPRAHELRIDAATLKRAIGAGRLLEDSTGLRFVPSGKAVTLQTEGQGGGFAARVPGYLEREMRYDLDSLDLVSDIGSPLQFEVAIDSPLHVFRGRRHAWLLNRI